jgi:hypothetical protein
MAAFYQGSILMKILSAAAMIVTLAAPAYAQIGPPDKMGGTGYSKQFTKSCSVYANQCALNNPGAANKCQSARAQCLQTGTFKGPKGKAFSGLAKN